MLEWQQNNRDFAQARGNATFHHRLPTESFHLLLGNTYGHGEGFWKEDTRTLDEAQRNNFDLICQKLRLSPADKLIEVGPGWGYLSMFAAEKYGAEVTSYRLVASQNDVMRMADAFAQRAAASSRLWKGIIGSWPTSRPAMTG